MNGQDINHNQATIDGNLFNKDDSLQCFVTPNDGYEDGSTVSSQVTIVQSTPPVLEDLTLEPYERDHCVVVGSYRPVKKWF